MSERFSDPLDQAAYNEERARQESIQAHKAKAARLTLPEVGRCYNCDEEIDSGLFCDADCRDDYEWREKRRRMNQ